MNEQNLYSFNNGLQAIIETFYESCGAMNVSLRWSWCRWQCCGRPAALLTHL